MNTAQDTIAEQLRFGLGDRLAKSLHVAGITSNDMADELEVSRTTISNYLNDRTRPKRLYLRMWALKTGAPLEWLETGNFPGGNKKTPTRLSEGQSVGPAGIEPTTSTVEYGRLAPVTQISSAPSMRAATAVA